MLKRIALLTAVLFVFMTTASFAGDLMKLIPADSAFVLHLNLTKILANENVKKSIDENMAKQSPEQKKAYDEFIQKTGIDPLKSITELMVFVATTGDKGKPDAAVLFNGTFDKNKIMEAIKADKKAAEETIIEKFEGFDAIKSKKADEGTGVFLDDTTAVVGTANPIKTVIDVKNGKAKDLGTNEKFVNLMKKIDTAANLWGAGVIPEELKAQAKNNPQAAPLANVNTVCFSFNFDKDITFNFMGEVDKKENMDQVMTALNGFLAMIKMVAGQTP
ncbi:MAG TPA: hypothetical protein PKO06_18685, partial [Candidatus Ozemobacteraceae bacterium]|nr:hypothetical protein [Candidatus Ozemobacteraceae bacterium]